MVQLVVERPSTWSGTHAGLGFLNLEELAQIGHLEKTYVVAGKRVSTT